MARQDGMAVISALLIAAVVAVIAAGMIERQGLQTRQVENRQMALQGQWALEGGLQLSRRVLFEQRLRDPLVRGGQPWTRPLRDMPSGSVRFDGQLEDEQGKFNLRNLVVDGQVDSEALATFQRLCALIGIGERLATAIAGQVIDSYPQRPPVSPAVPIKACKAAVRPRRPLPPRRCRPGARCCAASMPWSGSRAWTPRPCSACADSSRCCRR